MASTLAIHHRPSTLAIHHCPPTLRWGDMCDTDEEEDFAPEDQPALPASVVERDVGELVHPTEYSPAACETWMLPPEDMGIPAEVLERYKDFPKSVHAVFDTPEHFTLLCRYCRDFKNLVYGGKGRKLVKAFCGRCVTILSRAPAHACACGNPRHLDPLAKPSGKVCSSCHQAARRAGGAKKKGRGKRF